MGKNSKVYCITFVHANMCQMNLSEICSVCIIQIFNLMSFSHVSLFKALCSISILEVKGI